MTERQAILERIEQLRTDLEASAPSWGEGIPCDLDTFILLLGGISSLRKVPGMEGQMGFAPNFRCSTEEAGQVRGHLEEMFGITDRESLLTACDRLFSTGLEYAQFLSFWAELPSFEEGELSPQGQEAFRACKGYAAIFRDVVGERGFYAWDIGERIGLLRTACACGIITKGELRAMGWELAHLATDVYSSWQEYALSSLCGAVYFLFVQSGRQEGGLQHFCEMNDHCIRHLFFEDGSWARYAWYAFPQKQFALKEQDVKPLLSGWEGPVGCMATDRIMVEGKPVGYMYREEPSPEHNGDSGWRFFAGDEDEEYLGNPEYVGVYSLNVLCNYSPDIGEHLTAPYGTACFRGEDGSLQREEQ